MTRLENTYDALRTRAKDILFKDHSLLLGETDDFAVGQPKIEVVDPTNQVLVGTVPAVDAVQVDQVVRAARAAFDTGPWPRMTPGERERLILKLADLVERDADIIAEIEAVESGRIIGAVRAFDSDLAVATLRFMAGWATKLDGRTINLSVPYAPGFRSSASTRLEPVGVVAAITPWNVPFCQAAWKVAPALAAGCVVVLKPSEVTPLGALHLAKLAREAGIPKDVVNVVTGTGSEAGRALVSHSGVDKISFTGSTKVGREIGQVAAQSFKKVTLELGGKSPMIILPDADLETAIPGAAMGIFANHGQNCCAGSRLFVHRDVHDEVVQGIAEIARATVLGPSLQADAHMGPLVSKTQQERVLSFINHAQNTGVEIAAGGKALGGDGAYVEPTVLTHVKDNNRVAREEIFGPVLSVFSFETDEEAITRANDSEYGLGASVWTRDVNQVHAYMSALKAGTVWVNVHNILDVALPFGGLKNSGTGHDLGKEAVLANCNTKASVIALS